MVIDWNEVENLIRTEGDAEALRQKLLEMITPKEPPLAFEAGESARMGDFITRLSTHVCGGSVPAFYRMTVHVQSCSHDGVTATIYFNRRGFQP